MKTSCRKTPYEVLAKAIRGTARFDESMARHTSYGIGGLADLYVEPAGMEDLRTVLRFLRDYGVYGLWLGRGSNLLVSDQGIRGVVVRLDRFWDRLDFQGHYVRVGSPVSLGELVGRAADNRLGGIAFLAGIPGTLGGAVKMNAGAFGGELGTRVEDVETMTRDGERQRIHASQLSFRYRGVDGIGDRLILSVRLLLDEVDPAREREECKRLLSMRREKQPMDLRSCGSVFKRVPGVPSPGELIEKAGCKGLRKGGVEVSGKHANFFVNHGGAKAIDVWQLIQEVRGCVQDRFGVTLPLEVELVGAFPGGMGRQCILSVKA